jgi:hypothetical protein
VKLDKLAIASELNSVVFSMEVYSMEFRER